MLVLNLSSILLLRMSTLACSATESYVILDLMLSFILIHRGVLVHNLFQNCTMFVNFIQLNIQLCVYNNVL